MTVRPIHALLTLCLPAAMLLATTGCASLHVPTPPQPPRGCAEMASHSVDADRIGLPTRGARVTTATAVAASGSGAALRPAHCLVAGEIGPVDPAAPPIRFQLALPDAWNGKALMFGGGGLNGTVPNVLGNVSAGPVDKPLPMARGYATFGSDSGHQANALGSLDASFGLNDEALANYAGDALKKTRDVAIALIAHRYGRPPVRAYFSGGSTGGREAIQAVQRWPADWDGAIAWYPASAGMVSILGGHRMNRALAQPGAYPNAAKRDALLRAALQACDGLDGALDGLISHQDRCNAVFDPATARLGDQALRCADGADTGDHCLSDVQITAMKVINTPTRLDYLASGEHQHPGYNIWGADTGIHTRTHAVQPIVNFLAFNKSAPGRPMPADAPYISIYLDQWVRFHVTRDPSYDALSLDPENPGAWAARIGLLSASLDNRRDLSAFAAKGGKLLLAHGLNDVLVSSRSTRALYNVWLAQMGAGPLRSFVRYYEVPGYNHAVSSVFNATWDSLSALEQWVEQGHAPERQVTTDTVGVPGRTRPLCDYPLWPRYRGSGDLNAAESFTCSSH
ncbi:tannase/feruloyl esterase family alpha/beta hydrolase [Aquabacterium sp. OR-4]|uniref:tannase/feruloyl esterase family alpha/beta hydrolase n=1 Tax=Aquabacterium sp. OR-4 TaxID=2978127 RepID=UPI0021B399FC|nr:tannase/feruloyl esterase family alpha/beta hydrolase [Aquabacterium sp. OR-4]MDT7835076.1 tannase/feruloyl esterase family alpha/beta hydrolase [Aquabacterium sp. OR-4]